MFGFLFSCFSCSHKLHTITPDNMKPFVPSFTECKVISVYDGDTITVAAFLNKELELLKELTSF